MAERITQEDGINDNLPSGQVEGSAGSSDAVGGAVVPLAAADDPLLKLKEEIARGKQRRRVEIESRYPRVFGTRAVTNTNDAGATDEFATIHEWEFGFGWDGLIENLAHLIDYEIERNPKLLETHTEEFQDNQYEMPPFRITQMKEKFGGLRFYYEGGNNRIHGWAEMTENLSQAVCEVCGEIGHPCKNEGWMKTLCPECTAYLGYEPMEVTDTVSEADKA
jgi:hypothetical protein